MKRFDLKFAKQNSRWEALHMYTVHVYKYEIYMFLVFFSYDVQVSVGR